MMKNLILLATFLLLMNSVSYAETPKEKLKHITDTCIEEVSGMEKAFNMESAKIPINKICETLKKEDSISEEKCKSFFEQKKDAETVVDFSDSEDAYMTLFEACIETAFESDK